MDDILNPKLHTLSQGWPATPPAPVAPQSQAHAQSFQAVIAMIIAKCTPRTSTRNSTRANSTVTATGIYFFGGPFLSMISLIPHL